MRICAPGRPRFTVSDSGTGEGEATLDAACLSLGSRLDKRAVVARSDVFILISVSLVCSNILSGALPHRPDRAAGY
jgi:hypothetical protein